MDRNPEAYWDKAGEIGYGEAMFSSRAVEDHVNQRMWAIALDIARGLGLERSGHVLDFGCGDGAFANRVLAKEYAAVDGLDLSEAGIRRAAANAAGPHMRFRHRDLTSLEFAELPRYDGAFLLGILHHVKPAAPDLIRGLRGITDRVVVLEPNGDHLLRRLLELTPAYRAAGEDSFGTRQLRRLFEAAGFRCVVWRRLNLFPNFTPQPLFRLLRPLEPAVEASPLLRALCTVNMYGFAA